MTQSAVLAASGSAGTTQGFKNRIINGNMVISQRGTSFSSNAYTLDRWYSSTDTTGAWTITQSSTVPAGFTNSLLYTKTTGNAPSSGNYNYLVQFIEGYNTADLGWGTANAKTITLSFWAYSGATGTFGGTLRNSDANRSYPFTYTINAANTWEQKSVTVAGDTSGTWLTTNGTGICVFFDLGSGTSARGTAGAWVAGNYVGASGTSTYPTSTSGGVLYLTGVQLEVGTTATNFDFRSYGTELLLCQRYYEQVTYDLGGAMTTGQAITSSRALANLGWTVQKRTSATITYSGDIYVWRADANSYPVGTVTFSDSSVNNVRIDCTSITGSPLVAGNAAMIYPSTEVILKASAEL